MANSSFYLKEPKSKKQTLVYLNFSFDGKRLKYSTGRHILPSYWNPEKQKARDIRTFVQRSEFNQFLIDLSGEVNKIYLSLLNSSQRPSVALIRQRLDAFTNKKKPIDTGTLFNYINKLKLDRSTDPRYSGATIKIYQTAINKLTEFQNKIGKRELDFDDLTVDRLVDFKKFLIQQSFSNNYINKILVTIKTFLNSAIDDQVTNNRDYERFFKKHMVAKEDTENVYLSISELRLLHNMNLSENKRLERVRDAFIIGCFTGLRFSDFNSIKPENFYTDPDTGAEMLKIDTQKTDTTVVVPLHNFVLSVLERRKGEIPKSISIQKMNTYLKELCQLAGFTEKVITSITKGGKKVSTIREKWQMVTSHTARRSFATNAFKSGTDSLLIMKMTGHKTEKQFRKYLKFDEREAASIMAKSDFYKHLPDLD